MLRISLAAGLFGFPAASDCYAPDEMPPGAWLVLFVGEHADDGVYKGIFTMCKAGRAWVLRTAPKARLTLGCPSEPGDKTDAWCARLTGGLRQDLLTRGALPVSVSVRGRQCAHTDTLCSTIVSTLRDSPAITALEISQFGNQPQWCAAFITMLQQLAPQLPQLTSLTLDPCLPFLPPLASLPQLRSLTVSLDPEAQGAPSIDSCLTSCAAYLTLLTTVTLCEDTQAEADWSLLLRPASTTHTLTSFTTERDLDDRLLVLLLLHAPALQRLSVGCMALRADHSDKQWGVRGLRLQQNWEFDLARLRALPMCSQGVSVIVVDYNVTLPVGSPEDPPPAILARLPGWYVCAKRLKMRPVAALPAADHPAALRATLRQLYEGLRDWQPQCDASGRCSLPQDGVWSYVRDWDISAPGLALSDWSWTPDMLAGLAKVVPVLREKGVRVCPDTLTIEQLTDELLSAAVAAAPQLRYLSVGSLALQSDQHSRVSWPWEQATISTVDSSQLLRLPQLHGGRAQVLCRQLQLTSSMSEADQEALKAWLQHTQWKGYPLYMSIIIDAPAGGEVPQVTALKAQMDLLHVVRHGPKKGRGEPPEHGTTVCLKGWSLTHAVMRELSGLPQWASVLDLSKCAWPLQHAQYRALAQHVPAAFTIWELPGKPGSALLDSIAAGIVDCRAQRGPAPIALLLPEYNGGAVKVGEGVRLVRGTAKYMLLMLGINSV